MNLSAGSKSVNKVFYRNVRFKLHLSCPRSEPAKVLTAYRCETPTSSRPLWTRNLCKLQRWLSDNREYKDLRRCHAHVRYLARWGMSRQSQWHPNLLTSRSYWCSISDNECTAVSNRYFPTRDPVHSDIRAIAKKGSELFYSVTKTAVCGDWGRPRILFEFGT